MPFRRIATEIGVADAQKAYRIYARALRRQVPKAVVEHEIVQALDDLDEQRQQIRLLMSRKHPVVSQGRIVRDEDGRPLEDDGFQLACHDRLLKVAERRAKLLGMTAPSRARIEVLTRDKWQEAMESLTRELSDLDRQLQEE